MQRIVLLTLAASTCFAQFSQFAVTDDGRLYFTTQLTTAGEDSSLKVYRVTGDGVSLFASGGGVDFFGPNAISPLTSGDGSITGYGLNNPCRGGSCGFFALPRTRFLLQGTEVETISFDSLRISRNGRFLLGSTYDVRVRLIELPSQRTREFTQFLRTAGAQPIANSGDALLLDARQNGDPLLFVPFGHDPRPIPGTENALSGILSPGGGLIAYERQSGESYELVLTDPLGAAHRVLAGAPTRFSFQPSFANDGTLLYLQPDAEGHAVPMLLSPAAGPRPLLALVDGAAQAIIAGNAELAWISTAKGQLLRVRTADSVADEIVGETPVVSPSSFAAYPGSVIRVFGAGVTAETRFLLDGSPLVVSEIRGREAALQIPWDLPVSNARHTLTAFGPNNPFRQSLSFSTLTEPTITFERSPIDAAVQIAHQDFRGIVSPDDPARPGETLHLFTRNMGPVDRPVATGEPSPISPLARVVTPLACYLYELDRDSVPVRSVGLQVPFAGLAPGSIGIYQVDVTIPPDWPSPAGYLVCRMEFRGDTTNISIAALP